MKKYLLLILLTAFSFGTFAQMPGMSAAQANIGHVYGKIVDSLGKPIEFVSVVLLTNKPDPATKQNKEVLLKGTVTKANGEFSFDELPIFGKHKLKVSAVGYKTLEMPVAFQLMMNGKPNPKAENDPAEQMKMLKNLLGGVDKDLGNIKFYEDSQVLQGVTVTATKALFESDIDKKVFNVEKNIVTAGGTAVDIMKNVPSLQVDIDGNVKLRNASPQIFIDGRPTTLSLDQIPADAIEKVEVITNPSAKYDASGGNAGILNLVLKKNKKTGYNGMVNAGADRLGGGNVMANFNVRQNKINLSAMAMTNQMRSKTIGESDRFSDVDGIKSTIGQDVDSRMKGGFLFSRLGLDYFVTNRTTLSAAGIIGQGKFNPSENIDINTLRGSINTYSNRISATDRMFRMKGMQLGLKHNFTKSGEELTADINYFGGKNDGSGLYTTNYYSATNSIYGTQIQKNLSDGNNKFLTIQTDYVRPFGNKGSLEIGARAQINNLKNINENSIKALGSTEFKNISSATTNYESRNDVYAAYVSVAGAYKKVFSYKVGLRAESSKYDGKLLNTNEDFNNKFPISLFPSVFLSKDLKKNQQVQMSLTRRINRPNFFQLIPFVDYTDSLNITKGNADLVPEFTYSSEISYTKNKGVNTFIGSAYYKYTDNLITRFLGQEINPISGKTDLINTFINANSSNNYGFELTGITKPKKWWDLTANVNFYNSRINVKNLEIASTPALWSMFGKLNNNFKLPKKFTVQLSADYQSKTNLPISTGGQQFGPPSQVQSASQGYIKAFYSVDVAIKKTFFKDAASLTLSVNDIFRSRYSVQYSEGVGFNQTYSRLTNPQMVRLNFSYRFGKMDMSLFKRQNMKSQQEGMQNGMQMQ
ncbi:outer membrane beta-barrel family protein [Emticicia aquatilis]|nr:outer membrane beta-barrel family protein [Emticicia aquatilis]